MKKKIPFSNVPHLLQAVPIKLIYAYGQTDEIKYHGFNRGTKEVNLLRYITRDRSQEGEHFDFKIDNVSNFLQCSGIPNNTILQCIFAILACSELNRGFLCRSPSLPISPTITAGS